MSRSDFNLWFTDVPDEIAEPVLSNHTTTKSKFMGESVKTFAARSDQPRCSLL